MPWPTGNFVAQGLVLVSLKGFIHQQLAVNTFWFVLPGELGNIDWPAKLQELATTVLQCAITNLLPGLSSEFALNTCTARRMDVAEKLEAFAVPPANSVGALGEALPSTNAVVCSLRTPFLGKSRRGRVYIAGAPEGTQAISQVGGVTPVQLAAFFACLLTNFKWDTGSEDFKWVVYSRKTGYTPPSTYTMELQDFAPVSNVLVRSVLGTQRSRRIGSGA